jgi:hypothetical protein
MGSVISLRRVLQLAVVVATLAAGGAVVPAVWAWNEGGGGGGSYSCGASGVAWTSGSYGTPVCWSYQSAFWVAGDGSCATSFDMEIYNTDYDQRFYDWSCGDNSVVHWSDLWGSSELRFSLMNILVGQGSECCSETDWFIDQFN